MGVDLSWRIDGLSLTFALLISGIGTLIVLYSGRLPQGPSAAGPLLLLHADVHGRHAGAGAGRRLHHAVRVLGTDLDHLVPADRLRQSPRGGAARRLPGAGRHRHGRAVAAGRPAADLERHRCGRHVVAAGAGRRAARQPALPRRARSRARRRLHQIGAVPVPFLAAQRHAGADAGLGLSAFGDHGEGRCLSGDAAQSGDGRHGGMGDHPAAVRRRDADRRHGAWRCARPTSS